MPRGKTTTVTVSPDGCTITLRHRIYFHDADLFNPDFQAQVDDAKRRIAATWQPAGGFRCGECTILFEFEWVAVEDGATRDDVDGKHIFAGPGVSSQSGRGPDRRPGAWFSNDATMPVAAHEVGHEMGMTDKYRFVMVDPAAPDDPNLWREVPDPRGVGRGSQPRLPPGVHCVPKAGYPLSGIAYDLAGTPQESDLNEILAANGVECHCRKLPPAGDPPRTEHAHEDRPAGRRKATTKTGRAGGMRRDGAGRGRIPPPWADTDVPPPADQPEDEPDDGSDDPRDEDDPAIYGEEIERAIREDRPLVFVPGVMGSMLTANGQVVWPPARRGFVAQINAMRNPSVPKTATGLTPGVYEPLIKFIERAKRKGGLERTRPLTYEIFPYDWTSSCRSTGRELQRFIVDWLKRLNAQRTAQGRKPYETVDVIAHSFGGLLTRIAKRAGAPIDRQVFMGTPHMGAPKAYFTLHPGISYADSFGVVKDALVKVLLWWHADRLPDLPTREELLWQIALATDSAWEVLPDSRHFNQETPLTIGGANSNFWQHGYLGDGYAVNGIGPWAFASVWHATIADAMALKDALGPGPARPFQNIIADSHVTPRKIDFDLPDFDFYAVQQDKPGDATVPAASASAGGKIVIVKSEHGEIPSDKQAQEAIRGFLG